MVVIYFYFNEVLILTKAILGNVKKASFSFNICNISTTIYVEENVKSTSFNRGLADWIDARSSINYLFQIHFSDRYSWQSRRFWQFASHLPWLISSTFLLHVSSSSRLWMFLRLWLLLVIDNKIDIIFGHYLFEPEWSRKEYRQLWAQLSIYLSGHKATGADETSLNPITHFCKTFLGGEIWQCEIEEI